MMLRTVDMLVKQGNYAGALGALAKAREEEPRNPYVIAYEERVRSLLRTQSPDPEMKPAHPLSIETAFRSVDLSIGTGSGLPSVEGQLNAIATPFTRDDRRQRRSEEDTLRKNEENKKCAILAKISTLLDRANECLGEHDYTTALVELSRAALLDPENKDITMLEQSIRSAQDDARSREEQEHLRNVLKEEQRREDQYKDELARLQQDHEEKMRNEEDARREAHREKVQQLLGHASTLLAAGRTKEAQSDLAFILVLEPLNEDAELLGKQIAEKVDEQRQAGIEQRRKEEEEHKKRELTIITTIRGQLGEAKKLAAEGNFADALRTTTMAYKLDPLNEEVLHCENAIRTAQEEWQRRKEEEKRAAEKAEREKAEEAEQQRALAERERILAMERKDAEARRRADDKQILRHLLKAKELLDSRLYEGALAELALAFLINPFDENVKQFEAQILFTQEQDRPKTAREVEDEKLLAPDHDTVKQIAEHLAEANHYTRKKKFPRAFEEIARAFSLDPLNPTIQDCEHKIQSAFAQYQEECHVADRTNDEDTAGGTTALVAAHTRPGKSRARLAVLAAALVLLLLATGLYLNSSADQGATTHGTIADSSTKDTSTETTAPAPLLQVTENAGPASVAEIHTKKHASVESAPVVEPNLTPAAVVADHPAQQPAESSQMNRKDAEIINLDRPKIPAAALQSKSDEEVSVSVQIGEDGKPLQAEILKSSNALYNDPVMDAVMHSQYSPAVQGGGPVSTWITIPFRFKQ